MHISIRVKICCIIVIVKIKINAYVSHVESLIPYKESAFEIVITIQYRTDTIHCTVNNKLEVILLNQKVKVSLFHSLQIPISKKKPKDVKEDSEIIFYINSGASN